MLHREQYQQRPVAQDIDGYDALLQAFYAGQGMPPSNWSEQSVARLRGPASLHGRDVLRAALAELGFPLR